MSEQKELIISMCQTPTCNYVTLCVCMRILIKSTYMFSYASI